MNKLVTTGTICLKDDYNFIYKIANIDYVEYENGDFSYYFYPFYNVINLLNTNLFQGIPGIDLSKKLKCYERHNITPVFISERSPSENRENLWELLQECNMTSLNRLLWLIRTDTQYSGDKLYVENRTTDEKSIIKIESMFDLVKRSDSLNKALLKIICLGDDLICKEIHINDENRKFYYDLLMPIFIKEYSLKKERIAKGIEVAKNNNVYRGRKKINMDSLVFNDVAENYLETNISLSEALEKLKVSRSTFLRRLKETKTKK